MYDALRSILFHADAEAAHELAMWQLQRIQGIPPLLDAIRAHCRPRARVSRTVWGLRFANPLGLAAGFDKNATAIEALEALGFGFIEVGTVTLRPQPGNPPPRIFRFPRQKALVNRLGFNNDGAERVAERLRLRVERRGTSVEPPPPVFVNVGKNRDVDAAAAAEAYAACYRIVGPWADGTVVNVSSPNTPNLRDLQRPWQLREILDALGAARARFPAGPFRPILVKIAPDLELRQIEAIASVCVELADGIVATNTTLDHGSIPPDEDAPGGLSGAPLFERSTAVLQELRGLVGPRYPLVGVGGIVDSGSARAKLAAGADLIQTYTGFVYGGPLFVRRIVEELAA